MVYEDYRRKQMEVGRRSGLSPEAVGDGMDTWHWWVGVDNPGFWQDLVQLTGGPHNYTNLRIDFLRILMTVPRGDRWKRLGLINDPDTVPADKPDQFGLKIDRMKDGSLRWDPDKFGYSSGVIGLQLFKNEKFDAKAWSVEKYLKDPASVQPPYKVGMACAVCHIGFNPLNPPKNPANPEWFNLHSTIGNQFLREGLLFGLDIPEKSLIFQYLSTQEPGTSETSRFPTDSINNPTNINTIVRLRDRLTVAHVERITPAQAALVRSMYRDAGIQDDNIGGALGGTDAEPTIKVPHILTDGADSMGILTASARVYVNEGMMHQEWYSSWPFDLFDLKGSIERHFRPQEFDIIGKWRKDPNSPWNQTERRMPNMATFLMSYDNFPLRNAPGGKKFLQASAETLAIGRHVFADRCVTCHSSKRLATIPKDLAAERMAWRDLVDRPDFLDHNYLSDDDRHSVLEIGTNAQRAEGTNAMAGWTWGQMSSQTYKDQKKEQIELVDHDENGRARPLYNPITGQYDIHWKGSQAFYRTPTLVGIWATAPFFHNNALGSYNGDPSVKGRMAAFEDAAEKLLWPERRLGVKSIKVTSVETNLPDMFPGIASKLNLFEDMDLKLLSFPKGTPVNLVMNLNPESVPALLGAYVEGVLAGRPRREFKSLVDQRREAGLEAMRRKMLELNTCPDFIEDRGHTFGADLSDREKRSLIDYMKTF
jgi:mono/diheme cytochrome c family protein